MSCMMSLRARVFLCGGLLHFLLEVLAFLREGELAREACPPLSGGSGGRLGPRSSPSGGGFSATILVISRLGPASTGCT